MQLQSHQESAGLLAPISAILRDDENLPFVYVAQRDGSFAWRHVTLGGRVGDNFDIARSPAVEYSERVGQLAVHRRGGLRNSCRWGILVDGAVFMVESIFRQIALRGNTPFNVTEVVKEAAVEVDRPLFLRDRRDRGKLFADLCSFGIVRNVVQADD